MPAFFIGFIEWIPRVYIDVHHDSFKYKQGGIANHKEHWKR